MKKNNKNQKIMILIAPSEWKNSWNLNSGNFNNEKLSFYFEKPFKIWENATEKDLKCKWERFQEWIKLNKNIENWPFMKAINRYSWVVFNNINYSKLTELPKKNLEENLFILSWMYWILKPLDQIWNYKLPVETKWIHQFWGDKIAKKIAEINPDFIINLMPESYSKLVWIWKCSKLKKIRNLYLEWKNTKIININFFEEKILEWNKNWEKILKKISHGVKKFRWEFIKKICEEEILDYKKFWGEIIENDLNSKNPEFIEINFIR